MRWQKLGLIFDTGRQLNSINTHAMLPIAQYIKDDIFRIFFSPRDELNRSFGTYVDIDILKPSVIENSYIDKILVSGNLGYFDDCGAQPCSIVKVKNTEYLYYVGWTRSASIPFRTNIGLAIKKEGEKNFTKVSKAPIITWDSIDKLSTGWNYVLYHNGIFKMWYESNTKWELINNEFIHYFVIKYAESDDGINWVKSNNICIDIKSCENVVSRPCVILDGEIYKMWYSFKSNLRYRIGYAESDNGINWKRMDESVGIDVSESGWDSEQIEYPFVFDHKGERYMLYNGNGYGKTGFGLAKLIN